MDLIANEESEAELKATKKVEQQKIDTPTIEPKVKKEEQKET